MRSLFLDKNFNERLAVRLRVIVVTIHRLRPVLVNNIVVFRLNVKAKVWFRSVLLL